MAFLEPVSERRRLYGQLVLPFFWAAVTGFGIYLSPDRHGHGTHQQLGLPPCPSVLFFSRPCPGCGLTTSWTATIHGRFVEAFQAHALGPLLYLAFTFIALLQIWGFFTGRRLNINTPNWTRGIVAVAVIFFGYGMLRFLLMPNYAAPGEVTNFIHRGR